MWPWVEATWSHIARDLRSERTPHAWCLSGSWGLGLASLTDRLVARLLCHQVHAEAPCGHCQSCRFLAQGTHPDRFRLTSEGASGQIRVDAVREAIALVYSTSTLGFGRVIEVSPADALNPASSNALLKVVEEPPDGTRFVFATPLPGALLPTLRSRMRRVELRLPAAEQLHEEAMRLELDPSVMRAGHWLLQEPFVGVEQPDRLAAAEEVASVLDATRHGLDPQTGANRLKAIDPLLVLTVMLRVIESLIQANADPSTDHAAAVVERFGPNRPESAGLFQLLDRVQGQRMPTARGVAHMAVPGFGSLLAVWSHLWSKVQSR